MATDDDAGKAARRKPRNGRRVKVGIDWAFADPVDPDDIKPEDLQQLERGDLEVTGEVGGFQTIRFTPQYYLRTLPVADDRVAAFAEEVAIERPGELRQVLALIRREIDGAEPTSEWVMLWRGEAWDVPETYAAAHSRAVAHVDGLLELLSGPFWPVALDQQPDRARRALVSYRHWLVEFRFGRRVPEKGAPPLAKEQAAAYVLAWAWPVLTGEEPFVVQVQNDQKRPGRERDRPPSPFHTAFLRVCELFGLRKPNPRTLAGWLAASEERRTVHHAEISRLLGDD
jgi:hypothetical protein